MIKHLKLHQIKISAINHYKTPDDLIRDITKTCSSLVNIDKLYSKFGIIIKWNAQNLLNNNIMAAERQHDLADAEYFREQENQLDNLHTYFTETVHGCHIAPTISPVTYRNVIEIINKIEQGI